ncbi:MULTISPECIES: hypothetical protein [Paraburkholderia]|jgi:hypothetical protein|uniref:Uncharacterized protein n=2 Tax=Paraburkholderia TaxID=1822464 RepID=A0A972SSW0_9BURK|nr:MULTISPECIES: hypothetical protein [Paraburkholderia]KAE8753686.1 hypothetical protein FSO04_43815 [Paraburkholderia madseniana]MCX4152303.1 hypothetical protein [Paraburkholderia madseniana]MCX4172998.1 hypothetical protein [Paraburkholderia madseniana]MDN7155232.1 hypothetical protein [Paraburkholderia sp. WS6]MDQ6414115.1 hypothetical protein [Paraburkholderia madseniana]
MHVEVLGQYRLELSAMQLIHNGGWTAYVAIRTAEENHPAQPDLLPYQQVVDEAVFESEEAAIAGARRVALALLSPATR